MILAAHPWWHYLVATPFAFLVVLAVWVVIALVTVGRWW